jgi:HTH-type transcriptional regulator, competence development regulator
MKVLGARIKRLRTENKMTQKQLAEILKISESAVGMYERSEREPSFEIVVQLSELFKVTVDYLFGRTNKPDGIADQKKDETYDSLAEINNIIKELGIEDMGFFDIEKWKNLSPEDVEEIRKHFEWVAHKAMERNEEK